METISIIISTLKRSSDLKKALDSILVQTRKPDELVVVDQSEDRLTESLLDDFKKMAAGRIAHVKYLRITEKSLVKARNTGIDNAQGSILVFLDDDVVLFDDYLEKIEQFLVRNPDAAGISGRVMYLGSPGGLKWKIRKFLLKVFLIDKFDGKMTPSGFGYPLYSVDILRTLAVEMLPGCNMCFRSSAISGMRFDEWFSGYSYREDADFSYAASAHGKTLYMIPEARLLHNYSPQGRLDKPALRPMQFRNYYYVFRKYREKGAFSRLLFVYSFAGYLLIDLLELLGSPGLRNLQKLKISFFAFFNFLIHRGFPGVKAAVKIPVRIKVLHLVKTLDLGGAETNLANLVSTLDPEKVEVHVGYCAGGVIEERFRSNGRTKLFKFAGRSHRVKSPASIAIITRLSAYILKNDIQIVHAHTFNAAFWGGVAARLTGRKMIEHVHDFRYCDREDFLRRNGPPENLHQYGLAWVFKYLSDSVIVLTREVYRNIVKRRLHRQESVELIPNGIPIGKQGAADLSGELRRELGVARDAKIIFTSSRLSGEKNIGLILRIAAKIKKAFPAAVFLVAGTGPLAESLAGSAKELGVDGTVKFLGFRRDVDAILAASDVFLLPSFLELHSVAILEAMSRGIPVVVSRGVGSNDDFISDWETGILLDPFSDSGWAEAILKLLKDELLRRRIGQEGFRRCRDDFNIEDTAAKIQDLYSGLVR